MAANEYNISAGIVPIDNSTGATANSYYISAGLVPTDTAASGSAVPVDILLALGEFNGGFLDGQTD